MTRSWRTVSVLLGLSLVAAACGGGNGDEGDSEGPAEGSLEGQTVEVAAVWSGTEQERFQEVLQAFSDQTGAEVNFTSTGDDIATVLGTRIQGGSPPDVAMLPQPGLLNDLATAGSLKPASDQVSENVEANYAPIWAELGSVEGTLYGVWFKAANKSTVWYNVNAFDTAGVQPAETWDDFLAGAQTLADSGTTPVSIGGGDGWTLTDWFENVYLRVAGPEKYDQLTKHEIPWTDESVVTTLQELGDLWSQPNLIVGGADGALQTSFPQSVSQVFSDPPKGAIVYEGDFVAGVIGSETGAAVGEDAKFFPFPSINDSEPAVVGGGDVAVALKDSEGAQALLEYLSTPEAAEVWAALGGYISPNKNLDTGAYPDDTTREIAQALIEAGDQFRFDMSDLQPAEFGGTPAKGMWKILQDFLKDPSNPQATAQQLEQAAAAAFGS